MSNRVKRAGTFWILGLSVVVLIGFALGPRSALLLSEYQAGATKRFCEAVLAGGNIFPAAKSVDYTIQLNYCEHNPSATWGACGSGETSDMVDICRQY